MRISHDLYQHKGGSVNIPLTQGRSVIVDDEDLAYLNKWKWCYHRGYAVRTQRVNSKQALVYMHRLILNAQPGQACDHVNGDGLDNQRSNLRICTQSQNGMNRGKQKNNTSGFKGVTWNKDHKKWKAQIMLNGKSIYIGYFDDPEEASKAYNDRASGLFEGFVHLNQIRDEERTATGEQLRMRI
jgi:hypothetical protein